MSSEVERFSLGASARIVVESFGYRLRMREANNLPVVVTLCIASHLPLLDVLARTALCVVLNVVVYLTNDYYDIDIDLAASDERPHVVFLAANRAAARVALWGLTLLMAAGAAAYGYATRAWWPLVGSLAGAAVVWGYSAGLKRVPIADIFSMTLAGGCGALLGIGGKDLALGGPGLHVAVFIGLVCGSFNALQVVRDHDSDTTAGVRTSAVALGPVVTGWIFRAHVVACAVYGSVVGGSWAALLMLGAAPLSVRPGSAAKAWDITRVIGALAWLGVLVELYLRRA